MSERTYRISVVSQRTGLSEGLIRAWERRYGVLSPRRSAGGYRLYTEVDIELLNRLHKLAGEGVSIGEAAQLLPQLRREAKSRPPPTSAPTPVPAVAGAQLETWKAQLEAAAHAYDQRTVEAVLDEALASVPPLVATAQLLLPVLRAIGELWHQGNLSVAGEHLVSQAIRARLLGLVHGAPRNARAHAVCACLPDEDHELGLLGAALRLRHAGFRVTYLGPRTPTEDLARLAQQVSPDLILLAAVNVTSPKELRAALRRLSPALPRGIQLWVGGAGAEAHPEVCAKEGARLLDQEAGWAQVLALARAEG